MPPDTSRREERTQLFFRLTTTTTVFCNLDHAAHTAANLPCAAKPHTHGKCALLLTSTVARAEPATAQHPCEALLADYMGVKGEQPLNTLASIHTHIYMCVYMTLKVSTVVLIHCLNSHLLCPSTLPTPPYRLHNARHLPTHLQLLFCSWWGQSEQLYTSRFGVMVLGHGLLMPYIPDPPVVVAVVT